MENTNDTLNSVFDSPVIEKVQPEKSERELLSELIKLQKMTYDDIHKTSLNVQFFFWLTIISGVIYGIVLFNAA